MATIHIHELNSAQAIEVMAENAERAVIAYAFHNAFDRSEWTGTLLHYYRNSRKPQHLREIIVEFETERMTAMRLNGSNIWLVEWENI